MKRTVNTRLLRAAALSAILALPIAIAAEYTVFPAQAPPRQAAPALTGQFAGSANELALEAVLSHAEQLAGEEEILRALDFGKRDTTVYVALRSGGMLVREQVGCGESWVAALKDADRELARLGLSDEIAASVDTWQIDLCYDFQPIDMENAGELPCNANRGILGLEFREGIDRALWPPSKGIAFNLSFNQILEREERRSQTLGTDRGTDDKQCRVFRARQALLHVKDGFRISPMYRGNMVVSYEAVDRAATEALQDGMESWLVNQVREDGRTTYKYWPSRGEESESNNMIRQFMASFALARVATARPDIRPMANANLKYNLDHFYREEKGLGLIEYREQVKLGAVALAALAIMKHPSREAYREIEEHLRETVLSLWNPDTGEFRTFYKPADRNDNTNFYPGEALLLWAFIYQESRDAELLDRIELAFDFYRDWHRSHRNPAFIPWHTQAYFATWELTQDAAMKDFIFEMNDWLVETQQWDDTGYPDMRGRFYDPDFPGYGPPHASSTGVYLEGLADAYRLAKAVDDATRAERYGLAIRRGLRSIMQLQFVDEIDMFYISKRRDARGGIRTTVYNNEIRVDNVQHNYLATEKILRYFDF